MKQLSLIPLKRYPKRKSTRAISLKAYNHVVLKARTPVLRRHNAMIKREIQRTQVRFGVRLRALSVMENHIHFLVQVPSREAFANFLRVLAGAIALKISGEGKFWLKRAWSRIVRQGRDLQNATLYIARNPIKAACFGLAVDAICIRDGTLM